MKKNKIKEFIDNYSFFTPPKIFVFLWLSVLVLFICLFSFKIDNDFWFLINTGKYILNNGYPLTEPFTIHANLEFIVQQWLTDIIFYLIYNKFGIYGMFVFMTIINCIIITLIYKISLLITNNKVKISLIITTITFMLLNYCFIITRPQIFDIILLLIELYILELYTKNNNKKILLILPLISLLMINLHSSLWLMIFVFLIPYFIERIIHKQKIKPFLIISLLMLIFGLINPYGIKSIIYLFNSYGIEYINDTVGEMLPLNIQKNLIIYIYIFIVLLSFYYNKKNNKIRYILLTLGTCYLAISHYKGLLFFLIVSIISLSYNFKNIGKESNQEKYYSIKSINIFIIIMFVIYVIIFIGLLYIKNIKEKEITYLYNIANYLDNNAEKDNIIYTGYNDGAYLEYRGYKCYLDPRAEVFLKSNNKKEDIFKEYYLLQEGKINYKNFLDKYNFDYLIVNDRDTLFYYINPAEYEIVYTETTKSQKETLYYRIYKKIK